VTVIDQIAAAFDNPSIDQAADRRVRTHPQ
jgi:hypothetical protein